MSSARKMDSRELAWKIRRNAVEMTHLSNGSHIGSILSVADIIAVLYSSVMNYDPKYPNLKSRDRLILSKGHAGAAIYIALAFCGFFETEKLATHCMDGSHLSGHVSSIDIPGVDFSTGSLGHGLPVGCGMALALKEEEPNSHVFVILGDGECDEGTTWETALFANQHHLNNLIVIIDHNKMQGLDFCDKVVTLSPLSDKWKAFSWKAIETDGHDHEKLTNVLKNCLETSHKPTVIIAHTTKGKGISFMENNVRWHYSSPQGEEYTKACQELEMKKP